MRACFRIAVMICLLLQAPGAGSDASGAAPLQLFVDLTDPGGTLRLPPGTYAGPVIVERPLTIDGRNEVTVDGGGRGSVVTVRSSGVTIRGCRIVGSGGSHDRVDAAVLIEADGTLLEGNVLEDVLFGVHVSSGNGNTIRDNTITSRPAEGSLRGDGVRLWYGRGNLVSGNTVDGVRDLVLINSPDNVVEGNVVAGSRMGLELVYSPGTVVRNNHFLRNEHGVVGIYSDSLRIAGNLIEHQGHLQGSGVAVKGSSGVVIEGNDIIDCAVGLTANSPAFPENIIHVLGNTFAYNDVAMYFYGEKGGHVVHDNVFTGNFQDIAVTGPASARANDWLGNVWQDYRGFDRDGDGRGDVPYELYLYSERIWLDRPMTRFFRASPLLEVVDFVNRLAAVSEPWLILRDPSPRLVAPPDDGSGPVRQE